MSTQLTTNESSSGRQLRITEITSHRLRTEGVTILVTLGILLFVALFLRLYRLGEGLWLDEIITYLRYAKLSFAEIITTYDSENQHFLYSLLAHASLLIFGDSAWALRLPAALFGVGSIWAVYLVGREVSHAREALLTAALLTFSYHHVWFSQNARGYSGMLFWTLLSSWFLLRGLRENRPILWVYYAISASLGIYTHMTMGFVVVGQLLVCLIDLAFGLRNSTIPGSKDRLPWIESLSRQRSRIWYVLGLGFGLAGLITLLLYLPVLSQITGTVGGSEVSVVKAWKSPLWTLVEIVRGMEIGFGLGIAALGALALFGAGLIGYLRSRPAILGLLIFPPVIGAAVVIAIGHHLFPRFFFFAFGFAAMVVVKGIFVSSQWIMKRLGKTEISATRLGVALCIGLILISATSLPAAFGPKQDYDHAYRFVETNRVSGDQVASIDLAAMIYRDFYHADWQEVDSLDALMALRTKSTRTWLVYTFPPVLDSVHPGFIASIQRDFQLVKEFPGTVSGGTIYVYRSSGTELTRGE